MFAYEGVGREEEGRLYVSNSMGRECVCLQKRMMGRVRAGEERKYAHSAQCQTMVTDRCLLYFHTFSS